MKKYLLKKLVQFIRYILGKKIFGHLILFIAHAGQINLLTFAYNQIGILNPGNHIVSGENFVIKNILKKEITSEKPVLFDIGAHKGDYAEMLFNEFPEAQIFAFEPTFEAHKILKRKLLGSRTQIFNIGLGSEKATQKIYSYTQNTGSSHSSVFKEVFTKIYNNTAITEMDFSCTTIDDFCAEHNIKFIDFMKIDTEGSELNILRGATRMLNENRVRFIQFEFNEMNVISRVFLKDFYDILRQYELFRTYETKLIPLGTYDPIHEVFKFQNIFAINNNIK